MKDKANKKLGIILLSLLSAFSVHATNPASTDYVDAKIATLQAEIDQITQGTTG